MALGIMQFFVLMLNTEIHVKTEFSLHKSNIRATYFAEFCLKPNAPRDVS